jgi:S-adenosylmethionine:tRNA ribosyltransferase-isomerase
VVQLSTLSPRLVELELGPSLSASLELLYAYGRPVQYSYQRGELALWDVQNAYAGAPVAFEMPSAGRALTGARLTALRRRGVRVTTLTHAAGLSSTGDEAIDRALPLPERFEIPERTALELRSARERGARILAAGSSTVRALEGAAGADGEVRAGAGTTALKIGPGYRPRVVTGLLSGIHHPSESHFELLTAWAPSRLLRAACAHAVFAGLLGHEFGDSTLVLPGALEDLRAYARSKDITASM